MEYLASRLDDAGIAYQAPIGGHGAFIDAKAMFPQIPYNEYPGQVLAVELYIEAGIRTCDVGSYMLGNDPDTGEQLKADFEFTRLAIPRRVYTYAHMDFVADAVIELYKRRRDISGLKWVYEPKVLRFFTGTFETINPELIKGF